MYNRQKMCSIQGRPSYRSHKQYVRTVYFLHKAFFYNLAFSKKMYALYDDIGCTFLSSCQYLNSPAEKLMLSSNMATITAPMPTTSPVALETTLSHPCDSWLSPSSHTNFFFFKRPAGYLKVFSQFFPITDSFQCGFLPPVLNVRPKKNLHGARWQ